MEYTTISIKKETRKQLKKLQDACGTKSLDDLIKMLIVDSKKRFLDKFSKDFNERLKKENLTLKEIIESGEEIRKEILIKPNKP